MWHIFHPPPTTRYVVCIKTCCITDFIDVSGSDEIVPTTHNLIPNKTRKDEGNSQHRKTRKLYQLMRCDDNNKIKTFYYKRNKTFTILALLTSITGIKKKKSLIFDMKIIK